MGGAYDARVRRMTLAQTQKICEARARKEPSLAIARDVATLKRAMKTTERKVGGAAAALERALPAELLTHVWIEGLTSAQLTLGVEGAAAGYQVDRALREGGLTIIREALLAPALRVRTRVGQSPGGAGWRPAASAAYPRGQDTRES